MSDTGINKVIDLAASRGQRLADLRLVLATKFPVAPLHQAGFCRLESK